MKDKNIEQLFNIAGYYKNTDDIDTVISDLEERIDYVLSNFNTLNDMINTNIREKFIQGYDYNKLCLYWYNIFKDLSGVETST